MNVNNTGFWSWYLQRLTGIFLVFGMVIHIIVIHFSGEEISFISVAQRLTSPAWLIFDILLLGACLYHGFNGIWSIALDYNPRTGLKKYLAWCLILLGAICFIWGTYVFIPFTHL